MMLSRLIGAIVLALGLMQGAAALAQNSNSAETGTHNQGTVSLPQKIKQKLQKQGFTDVKVVPGSFIVSAKDQDGDPVTAILGPHSMTVFSVSTADHGSTSGNGNQSRK